MKLPVPVSKFIYFILNLINGKNAGLVLERPVGALENVSADFYNLDFIDMNSNIICFRDFKGKKVLLVNTASACGYTQQYKYLEKLYQLFSSQLVIVAFPSDDFGRQEPGNNDEINLFCKEKFHITFLLSQKIKVKGPDKHKVYQWLTMADQNGWNGHEPGWNFCKYLVNEEGMLVNYFCEKVNPLDQSICNAILK